MDKIIPLIFKKVSNNFPTNRKLFMMNNPLIKMFVFVPCDKNIIHCLKILCIVREMQSGTEFWILFSLQVLAFVF
jgi:hypothetical protein